MTHSPTIVLSRINKILEQLVSCMEEEQKPPQLVSPYNASFTSKYFTNISQCRSLTSIVLVLSFVQKLLLSNRTTTNREVYYFFITYFRSQRECDNAISDVCSLLAVERISLGLSASPKGWFCGNIKIIHNENVMDGRSLSSIQGLPITREWIHRAAQIIHEDEEEKEEEEGETMRKRRKEQGMEEQSQQHHLPRHRTTMKENNDDKSIDANTSSSQGDEKEPSAADSFHPHPEACFNISSDAEFILVIEKEGVYTRLSEDQFYDRIPCILITGKGFPDVATRAMVFCLSRLLNVPVMGLADCNPYGVAVLQSYFRGGRGNGGESNMERFSVPIQWMGLRPSQLSIHGLDVRAECADLTTGGESGVLKEVEHTNLPFQKLPKEVFQKLSDMDMKKLKSLLDETNEFVHLNESRRMELELMKQNGWKVELESLHWLGMDFMSDWLEDILLTNKERMAQKKLGKRFSAEDLSDREENETEHFEQIHLTTFDPRIAC